MLMQEFAANARSFGGDLRRWPEDARARALAAVVHACDIGNPAKPLALSLQWSERIIAENFAQVGKPPVQALQPLCLPLDHRKKGHLLGAVASGSSREQSPPEAAAACKGCRAG